eukprot:1210518-Heterocapsa_arctica.AAC.1
MDVDPARAANGAQVPAGPHNAAGVAQRGQQQTAPAPAAPTQGAPGLFQAQHGQSQGAEAQAQN